MHTSTRLLLSAILSTVLVWALATYFSSIFVLQGGIFAMIVVGSLLTLMNIVVRPLLDLLTLPLKLFATILAVILANGIFLYIVTRITEMMDPSLVRLSIGGGVLGWVELALIVGFAHWVVKELLKDR